MADEQANALADPAGKYVGDFQQIVLRSVRASLRQIQQLNGAFPADQLQRRALAALDYGLNLPDAWEPTRELLFLLAPTLEQATQRYNWLTFLQRGLCYSRTIADWATAGALGSEIGILLQRLGDLVEARTYLEQACARLRLVKNNDALVTALGRLAELARIQRCYGECTSLTTEIFARVAPDSVGAAYAYFVRGKAAFDQSQLVEAESCFRQALAIWSPVELRRAALCIQNLGRIAWKQAQYATAIQYFEEALASFKEQQDQNNRAVVKMNLGIVYWEIGQITDALRYYEQASAVFRELNHPLYLAMVYNNCGLAYSTLQQWRQAEECYHLSIALWAKLGDVQSGSDPAIGLGVVYTQQARLPEALALFATTAQQLHRVDPARTAAHLWAELETHWATAKAAAAAQGFAPLSLGYPSEDEVHTPVKGGYLSLGS